MMIDTVPTQLGELALESFAAAAEVSPAAATELIQIAWRHSLRPTGTFDRWDGLDLPLPDVVKLRAIGVSLPPPLYASLVESAAPSPAEDEGISASATIALRDADIMRWISANAARVAASPNWHEVVTGLGGLTVSVPLAEEALINLMRAKCKLPRRLAAYVQLNPWFSRRFAIRFRRRMGGKRIRIRERGATARAWSHARTTLGTGVPFEWSSIHGRGVGRPLDRWSEQLLADYTRVFDRHHEEGVPPAIASLYAIAAGAIGADTDAQQAAVAWHLLPLEVENRGRTMLGIGLVDPKMEGRNDASALIEATRLLRHRPEGWREFVAAAYVDGAGPAAAVGMLTR